MDSSWGSFVVWFGYVIHQAPGPMMALSPTVELAKRNSKLGIRWVRGERDPAESTPPGRSVD
jgi:hypothetical protein